MGTEEEERAAEAYLQATDHLCGDDEHFKEAFLAGVAWRDQNPSDAVKGLVEALEFYAGHWGIHHGYDDCINEVVQHVLNETCYRAKQALATYREQAGALSEAKEGE